MALLIGAEAHLKAGKVLTSMKLHLASRRLTSVNFDWSLDVSIGAGSGLSAIRVSSAVSRPSADVPSPTFGPIS
ncbi:hypothetical protein CIT31_15885 [Mesorhizobium wenxiniae]|uniref:Uncharacterized protein n=1 Tax=Mesorhizobium wenxiniae TaxID=2014805 RepID=A0A271KKC9_9HYPH|nr:hypothetical protein CIT31_15885 [Mesorhizobium wenxiniae]